MTRQDIDGKNGQLSSEGSLAVVWCSKEQPSNPRGTECLLDGIDISRSILLLNQC